jgi:hypothetical protein
MSNNFFTYTLNDKEICLHASHVIKIQIGYKKGKYKTVAMFSANEFGRTIFIYGGYNIANGYKKRMIVDGLNKPVLHRTIT